MVDREDLVKNIKKFCLTKDVNIRQMEEELNFSAGLISRWTRMSPSIEKIILVAEYLNVSLDVLVGRKVVENTDDFIERICEKTKDGKLEWRPCGHGNPFSYPVNQLRELQNLNGICGYCAFMDGFFLLACAFNEQKAIDEIGLYILANKDERGKPTRWPVDGDELLPLYDLIQDDIIWKEDKLQVEKFKEAFMKNDNLNY